MSERPKTTEHAAEMNHRRLRRANRKAGYLVKAPGAPSIRNFRTVRVKRLRHHSGVLSDPIPVKP